MQASPSTLLKRLSIPGQGLTSAEAQERLETAGPNEPAPVQRTTLLRQLLLFFTNPLVLILLIASIIAGVLGEVVNAIIIVIMVLLSVALNFVQTARSQQAADRLRAQVAPTATVRRDGEWKELHRREIVPGDVIRLGAGDLVPADARLLEAHDLHVQQAALTGESLPAEKEAIAPPSEETPLLERLDMVFLGTSVVSGAATAVVLKTGRATAFGDIAVRLATNPPETEFERGMRRFSLLIMRTVVFLVLFVFLVNVAFQRDLFESLLFAIALAVGLTPEF
ncbi:MAG TPA: HAD-IC family P-type ATPase, partial [Ktedonobacteraceae bacterium]|nr:HAD-IC family P-type ATPase [Ktedonobacteraceae bacterium]